MISAACKIEFIPTDGDSIVLVDAGGWMESLPRFTARQALFEPDGIHQADGFIKPLGGVLVDINFATVEEPGTAAEMWAGFLNAMPTAWTGALVLTGGGQVTTFAPAVMTSTAPALPGPDGVLVKRWQVQAALPETEDV
ncbi:MAG: hypothetical protein EOP83_22715 [Verrucomicrobiaceae bacterium]|nr:MAG: hypothetical protein EOP83_22715 [Verrucomicrobiaceae bacterium]